MNLEVILFVGGSALLIFLLAVGRFIRLSVLDERSRARLDDIISSGASLPPTLHPVFDPTRCIGSMSCTVACPQGNDVIGLIAGRGALVDPTACIGHGRCAAECPMGAIRLVFGQSERGVDIPHLRPSFETNVDGLYITGELGGMGLIRNAVRQSLAAMEHIKAALRGEKSASEDGGVADVAIVGAGPAGLAAALAAKKSGLSYRWLEREPTIGGSVLHYPSRKIVLTESINLPLLGKVHARRMVKEELLELWEAAVGKHGLKLETGVTIKNITRENDAFAVDASNGPIRARKVMLCIGRRGTPRRLGVPGEQSSKVAYTMRDPEAHAGRKVLVVGGGNSALEAASQLAEETDAQVTFSHRGKAIGNALRENRERLAAHMEAARIRVLSESEVLEIGEKSVRLKTSEGEKNIDNDDVLVFIGGEPPMALLDRAGIKMERHFGEEVAEHREEKSVHVLFDRIHKQARAQGLQDQHRRSENRYKFLIGLLAAAGALLVFSLLWAGREYYFPAAGEAVSEAAKIFRPAGFWGQTVGAIAFVFMFVNFSYYVRKEFAFMKGFGDIRNWIDLHVISGLLSGSVALIHSTLALNNLFAAALYISLGVVIFTGVIGRYIYAFVPIDPRGRALTHQALQSVSERMARRHEELYKSLAAGVYIDEVLKNQESASPGLLALIGRLLFWWPPRYVRLRRLIRQAAGQLKPGEYRDFDRYARGMFRLRFEMDLLPHLKKLLGFWRTGHAVLAFFLIFLVCLHVAIEFWVGYRWIF